MNESTVFIDNLRMIRNWRKRVDNLGTTWTHDRVAFELGVALKHIDYLLPEAAELKTQRDHWKANHDHIKLHLSVLRDRPDLPVDRHRAYQELARRLEGALEELAAAGRGEWEHDMNVLRARIAELEGKTA